MFSYLLQGLRQLLFPTYCLACNHPIAGASHVCLTCKTERFVDPNEQGLYTLPEVMLPENVAFLDVMWQFDRSGGLRRVLHVLKYQGIEQVGDQLGELLAEKVFFRRPELPQWQAGNTYLVPVPLHKRKQRSRGYNQAECIARGISGRTGIPVLSASVVIRTKHTITQTGFNQKERIHNMTNAFEVRESEYLKSKRLLIIDDVFTTGSTTFELAQTLHQAGGGSIGIITVAIS